MESRDIGQSFATVPLNRDKGIFAQLTELCQNVMALTPWHHPAQDKLDGREARDGLCPNFLLKNNRERHRNHMPADKAAGTDRPDHRYGCSRNSAERPRALSVPGLRTNPQMDTQWRMGGRHSKTRCLTLKAIIWQPASAAMTAWGQTPKNWIW